MPVQVMNRYSVSSYIDYCGDWSLWWRVPFIKSEDVMTYTQNNRNMHITLIPLNE